MLGFTVRIRIEPMRTTLNIDDDALIAARHEAQRARVSLGEAVSELVRRGAAAGGSHRRATAATPPLRGKFALLALRDEVITSRHVRDLMEREGI